MTVRVEKLQAPVSSLLTLAVLGLVSTATAVLLRWWQRPTTMVMSDDWLNEHARIDSHQGWDWD
jgi:antibiotic biosynthesis monooxygenase (ABM) superfamily enzyme